MHGLTNVIDHPNLFAIELKRMAPSASHPLCAQSAKSKFGRIAERLLRLHTEFGLPHWFVQPYRLPVNFIGGVVLRWCHTSRAPSEKESNFNLYMQLALRANVIGRCKELDE